MSNKTPNVEYDPLRWEIPDAVYVKETLVQPAFQNNRLYSVIHTRREKHPWKNETSITGQLKMNYLIVKSDYGSPDPLLRYGSLLLRQPWIKLPDEEQNNVTHNTITSAYQRVDYGLAGVPIRADLISAGHEVDLFQEPGHPSVEIISSYGWNGKKIWPPRDILKRIDPTQEMSAWVAFSMHDNYTPDKIAIPACPLPELRINNKEIAALFGEQLTGRGEIITNIPLPKLPE